MAKPEQQKEFVTTLAWDEYKLLQNKLDKLGDFRFKIKGWAVTVGTGLIAGGAVGGVSHILTCTLSLFVLLTFCLLELYYNRVHFAVVRRLSIIERHLVRQQRAYKSRFRFAAPGLVQEIKDSFKHYPRLRQHAHCIFYVILAVGLIVANIFLAPQGAISSAQEGQEKSPVIITDEREQDENQNVDGSFPKQILSPNGQPKDPGP